MKQKNIYYRDLIEGGVLKTLEIVVVKKGGFNIDVGKLVGSSSPPLNILNLKWPNEWKILLILDKNIMGVHGKKEIEEFFYFKQFDKLKCVLT